MLRAEDFTRLRRTGALLGGALALAVSLVTVLAAQTPPPAPPPPPPPANVPFPVPPELVGVELGKQTDAEAQAKSAACVSCHQGARDPHYKDTVRLGCTDCHGGNPPQGAPPPDHGGRGCPAAPPTRNPEG